MHTLAEAGLRHRDLRPTIFVRSKDPDLVIGGFGPRAFRVRPRQLRADDAMAPVGDAGEVAPGL